LLTEKADDTDKKKEKNSHGPLSLRLEKAGRPEVENLRMSLPLLPVLRREGRAVRKKIIYDLLLN
jgi:hypothetical protein